jgi:hypothetical protein
MGRIVRNGRKRERRLVGSGEPGLVSRIRLEWVEYNALVLEIHRELVVARLSHEYLSVDQPSYARAIAPITR